MLLDWVNTIDEPSCLLVSNIAQIYDGSVILDILKNFLEFKKLSRCFYLELKTRNRLLLHEKYDLIFTVLNEFIGESKIKKFKTLLSLDNEISRERMTIELLSIIRELYAISDEEITKIAERRSSKSFRNLKEKTTQGQIKNTSTPCIPNKSPPKPYGITKTNINIVNPNSKVRHNCRENKESLTKMSNNLHRLYTNPKLQKTIDKSLTPPNRSRSPDRSRSVSPSSKSFEYNKVYTKKEKAELSMTRGVFIKSKHNHIEVQGQKIQLVKFIKPTDPVLDIDYESLVKYAPPLSNQLDITAPQEQDEIVKDKENNFHDTKPHPILDYYVEDEVSLLIKNKIYFWLVDLGLIKENSIKVDDLPNLCVNGVLFADLINRLEGRFETIKGIIRKTTTKSQIQINLNKSLEYLRNKSKFSSRHLWSGSQIAAGDPKTIWEFLDDIWKFYSNKLSHTNHSTGKQSNRSKEKKENYVSDPKENDQTSTITIPSNSNIGNYNFKKIVSTMKKNKEDMNTISFELSPKKSKHHLNLPTNESSIKHRSPSHMSKISNTSTHLNIRAISKCFNDKKIHQRASSRSFLKESFVEHKGEEKNSSARSRLNKTPRSDSTNQQNNCFIIFHKSNAKKLKHHLERNLKINNTFTAVNPSIASNLRLNNEVLLQQEEAVEDKNENYKQFKLCSTNTIDMTEVGKKDDIIIKEWIISLGLSDLASIDFSKNEIQEFKDGLLLCQILGILEKRKVLGINSNPKGSQAMLKNISKCFEILRNKKTMPYDYLWNEDEVYQGNGYVIRNLLAQIKRAYDRD